MRHPISITSSGKIERTDRISHFVSSALRTTAGRQQLARAMIAPITKRLNYQSLARKCFVVDQLPAGALPDYTAGRVVLPTFEIVSNPTIRLGEVKARRFNIIDRWSRKSILPPAYKKMVVWK